MRDVMDSTPSTADRLIFAAMKLFLEKGYGSTSVQDILREAKANAGSLYHAFPTKQDVLLAVLDMYRQGIGPMLLAPAWDGVDDPIERIFALLGAYRRALEMTDCTYGCPIGSLALELHEPDPPVRELLAVNFDGWVDAVKGCLDAAADRLPPGTDTRGVGKLDPDVRRCRSSHGAGERRTRPPRRPHHRQCGVQKCHGTAKPAARCRSPGGGAARDRF